MRRDPHKTRLDALELALAPKGRPLAFVHNADDGDFDAAFAAFKAEKQVTPRDNLVVIRMTYQDAPNRL